MPLSGGVVRRSRTKARKSPTLKKAVGPRLDTEKIHVQVYNTFMREIEVDNSKDFKSFLCIELEMLHELPSRCYRIHLHVRMCSLCL